MIIEPLLLLRAGSDLLRAFTSPSEASPPKSAEQVSYSQVAEGMRAVTQAVPPVQQPPPEPTHAVEILKPLRQFVAPMNSNAPRQQLAEAVEVANAQLQANLKTRHLELQQGESAGTVTVLLVEKGSGRVIREYPPEKIASNPQSVRDAGMSKHVIG